MLISLYIFKNQSVIPITYFYIRISNTLEHSLGKQDLRIGAHEPWSDEPARELWSDSETVLTEATVDFEANAALLGTRLQ